MVTPSVMSENTEGSNLIIDGAISVGVVYVVLLLCAVLMCITIGLDKIFKKRFAVRRIFIGKSSCSAVKTEVCISYRKYALPHSDMLSLNIISKMPLM